MLHVHSYDTIQERSEGELDLEEITLVSFLAINEWWIPLQTGPGVYKES